MGFVGGLGSSFGILKFPYRVQHFLWILLHGKILTNHQRVIRGMAMNASCPRCESSIEDIEHSLRGCIYSIVVWESVSRGITSASYKGDQEGWLLIIFLLRLASNNFLNGKMVTENLPNHLQFASVLWFLWKWRCKRAFDVNFFTPMSPTWSTVLSKIGWMLIMLAPLGMSPFLRLLGCLQGKVR
ncbi:hypothetical protein Dsin_000711 [Dipteronia sinensis]|uniref:Reverse transcriptase zinc-binding domain-containing protein n=1 Tax=Dipteronia sinensis TaxID=43782 RepID=A0AAE0B3Y9_9ROSI|nr:hypothetical protein Dsin_000711 [Dipteronia sinensis]